MRRRWAAISAWAAFSAASALRARSRQDRLLVTAAPGAVASCPPSLLTAWLIRVAGVGVGVEEGAGYPGRASDGRIGNRRLVAPEAGDGVADLLQFLLGGAAAGLDRGRGAVRGHAVSSSSSPFASGWSSGTGSMFAEALASSVARNPMFQTRWK